MFQLLPAIFIDLGDVDELEEDGCRNNYQIKHFFYGCE